MGSGGAGEAEAVCCNVDVDTFGWHTVKVKCDGGREVAVWEGTGGSIGDGVDADGGRAIGGGVVAKLTGEIAAPAVDLSI